MFDFKQSAISSTTLSKLMDNREKISTQDIMNRFPNGITVIGIDIIKSVDRRTGELSEYPVYIFAEDDSVFAFGGTVFNGIVQSWLKGFDGNVEACSNALKESGGCKFKITQAYTSNGTRYNSFVVVD